MLGDENNQVERDFLSRLGNELIRQQDRRLEHVKLKFTFVIALFGLIGAIHSVHVVEPLAVNLIIWAVPLVAALFDRYILGGEFAVKRIRSFLIVQDVTRVADAKWADYIVRWPKDFMRNNRRFTTAFISIASCVVSGGNLYKYSLSWIHWLAWGVWLVCVVGINIYLIHVERTIRRGLEGVKMIR